VCKPACIPDAPVASCASAPGCGDGVCTSLENCRVCPGDCATCPIVCGDHACDAPTETVASCHADCG
jgi:hypothetical protein